MLELFKRLFGPPPLVAALSEVRPGRIILEGTLQPEGPLLHSPIKNVPCVAFYYQAWFQLSSRGRTSERPLTQVEVYAPRFALELEGGRLPVLPKTPGAFEASEHQRLMASPVDGFSAREQLIRPGDRVRIHGRVELVEGELGVRPEQIEILEAAAETRPPKGAGKRPKARR